MIKARSAIENTLSQNLNFMDLKDIIIAIIEDPDVDLGYEYVPQTDTSVFEIKEEDDVLGKESTQMIFFLILILDCCSPFAVEL